MSDNATSAPFNWREHLNVHPAADLFPLLSESELKELAEDIKKNRLRAPIVLWGNERKDATLIDGRNRLDALALAGLLSVHDGELLTPCWIEQRWLGKTETWTRPRWHDNSREGVRKILARGDDPFAYALSLNIHRRHLTAEQKRDLIAKLLKRQPETSDRQIGGMIKADNKTVAAVRAEMEGREEIPHVETRTDSKGRKQPAKREPRADETAERAYNDTLKITGIQRPKARKDLEQLAKQVLTGLAQAFTKRADSLRTVVQFRDALPDDIRRQLRNSLRTIQHETGALADQLEDKPPEPTAEQTALQPTDDTDAEQPETAEEEANRESAENATRATKLPKLNPDGVSVAGCKLIYAPAGQAGEYAPLSANPYRGCGHGCAYCYVPDFIRMKRKDFDATATPKPDYLKKLEKDAAKYQALGITEQVMLSFSTDVYNPINSSLTRPVIQILRDHGLGFCVLTKGGSRALADIDLYRRDRDAFASTLTSLDDHFSKKWERNAALPGDRIETLKAFHDRGIFTWVSLEPTLDCDASIEIVRATHSFVDLFKVGRVNHDNKMTKTIDWEDYTHRMIAVLKELGAAHYIKKDLQPYLPPNYPNPLRVPQPRRSLASCGGGVMRDNVIKLAPSGTPSEPKPRHLGNWFRVYQSILDDPKVQQLSAKNFRALINLWALASQNHGALPSENDIAFKLRLKPNEAAKVLADLKSAGLIDETDEGLKPHNWSSRQFKSDSSTERVRRHREQQRNVS